MLEIFGKSLEFAEIDKTSSLELQVDLEALGIHFYFYGLKFRNTKKFTIAMALKTFFLL